MEINKILREKNIEKRVLKTIKEFGLITKKDKVAVALSGGKDSIVLLYILYKHFDNVFAVIIDEGIKPKKEAIAFCKKNNIRYYTASFKAKLGKTLPEMIKTTDKLPCTICGTKRRELLNKLALRLNATKLATGHNMDDEVESFFMNMFKANTKAIKRQGIKSKKSKAFVTKIKPLYFCRNDEIKKYADKLNLDYDDKACKYQKTAFRKAVRKVLKKYEKNHKSMFENIILKIIA